MFQLNKCFWIIKKCPMLSQYKNIHFNVFHIKEFIDGLKKIVISVLQLLSRQKTIKKLVFGRNFFLHDL